MKNILLATVWLVTSLASKAGAPTKSPTNLQFPVQQVQDDKLTLTFTKGDGAYRIVVIQEGFPVAEEPANGVDYTANSVFGTRGTEFTAAEGYVVYRGKSNAANVTVTVTHLKPGVTYYVSVFEFNGKGRVTEYLKSPLNGNQCTKRIAGISIPAGSLCSVPVQQRGSVEAVRTILARFYRAENNILALASREIIAGINRYRVTSKDSYATIADKYNRLYQQRLSI